MVLIRQGLPVMPSGMSISGYVIKFEQLYFMAKSFHMGILDSVLACRLLNSANLNEEWKQLVKARVSKTDYQITKDQLKKFFTSSSCNVHNKIEEDITDVKPDENDVFYTSRCKNYRQQNSYRGSINRNNHNFKNKNCNRKTNPFNKVEIPEATFVGLTSIREKNVQMLQKNPTIIYDYMKN